MRQIDSSNAVDYLHSTGRLEVGIPASVVALEWGVSNVVLRICPEAGDDFVIKQSREQLRTQADWFSQLDRIWREVDVLKAIAPLLSAGAVPQVLFEDRENYLFGMQAIDADHVVWKADLLEGKVDLSIARVLGGYLATIHRETADNEELLLQFADTQVFDQLRLDPFYRRISQAHAGIAAAIETLISETTDTKACLVLGDFSPKNILITGDGLTLVDFETGHYGDPAFDLGFFLSHLLLKTVLHKQRASDFLELAGTFWSTYCDDILSGQIECAAFDESKLERRSIANLAGCMLARIDGKSTVDYLPDKEQQDFVRQFCIGLLENSPRRMPAVFERLGDRL